MLLSFFYLLPTHLHFFMGTVYMSEVSFDKNPSVLDIDSVGIYKDGSWKQTNVPKAVFDTIDGKRQIFVKKPTSSYMTGDLWIISESDCTNGKIIVNGITYNANSTLIAVLPNGVTERTSFTESDWTDISTQDGIVALDQSTQALNKFSDIANDSKITPTEKQSIKLFP